MSFFQKILKILSSLTTHINTRYREQLVELYHESTELIKAGFPPVDDFTLLLREVHNTLITCDSALRAILIRLVRMSIKNSDYCLILVKEEFHWLIIASLEREHEFVQERMQALKCIRRYLELSPSGFPVAFARSLVAVANNKDDNIRRVCLETLRELTIINSEIVLKVNGMSSLLEAVIEPNTQDMAESILLSILFLLNDPSTRCLVFLCHLLEFADIVVFCVVVVVCRVRAQVRPYLDLRTLVSTFSLVFLYTTLIFLNLFSTFDLIRLVSLAGAIYGLGYGRSGHDAEVEMCEECCCRHSQNVGRCRFLGI